MVESLVDSAIIATLISVAISLTILIIREKHIEPQKFKKSAQLNFIENQLKAYGELLTILDISKSRSNQQNMAKNDKITHTLKMPNEANDIKYIFGQKRYLLSDILVKEYLSVISEDTYFAFDAKEKHDQNIQLLSVNFQKLQKLAKSEYDKIYDEFKEIVN